LSEERIGLAFFDEELSAETKDAKIENFVTKNTMQFSERLSIRRTFLAQNPETWKSNTDYLAGYEVVNHLEVVHDHGERARALIQEYNDIITKG